MNKLAWAAHLFLAQSGCSLVHPQPCDHRPDAGSQTILTTRITSPPVDRPPGKVGLVVLAEGMRNARRIGSAARTGRCVQRPWNSRLGSAPAAQQHAESEPAEQSGARFGDGGQRSRERNSATQSAGSCRGFAIPPVASQCTAPEIPARLARPIQHDGDPCGGLCVRKRIKRTTNIKGDTTPPTLPQSGVLPSGVPSPFSESGEGPGEGQEVFHLWDSPFTINILELEVCTRVVTSPRDVQSRFTGSESSRSPKRNDTGVRDSILEAPPCDHGRG